MVLFYVMVVVDEIHSIATPTTI